MKTRSKLSENIVSLFALQGANYALPLLTIPYLTRTLGPENFGKAAVAQAIAVYFVILTDYGFNLSATKKVVEARGNIDEISQLAASVYAAKLILAAISLLAMTLAAAITPGLDGDYVLILASYTAVLGTLMFPLWLFQGLQKMKQVSLIMIAARLTTTASIFVFVQNPQDFRIAVGLQGAATVLAALISFVVLPREMKFSPKLPVLRQVIGELRDGWHVFLATAGGILYTGSNVIFLALVAPPMLVGQYAAAEKFIKAVQSLISPISQAIYPHIASTLLQSRSKALLLLRKLIRIQSAAIFAVSLGILLFSEHISNLLFGPEFQAAGNLIQIMSLIPLLIAINNVLGSQVLVQFKASRLLVISILVPALLHLALLYPVALSLSAVGVCILAVWSEFLVAGIRVVGIRKHHPDIANALWGSQRKGQAASS
ncbi:flippase [Stenotrophomonas maltophilia]|uniref:flippase n=1 Tax=Stenotrophomonas maltophilia TaxID=40324 RepID=UPI0009B2DD44|nr:flippase [Stenotrophomonas maltophilia]